MRRLVCFLVLAAVAVSPTASSVVAAADQELLSGIALLPNSAAGVVRVISVPDLCEQWHETSLSGILDEPTMKPLIDANFGADGALWKEIGDKVGVRPEDLYEIATGEVVAAWLPFEEDLRQPSCLTVIADVRGKQQAAQTVLDRIDKDLKNNGATRSDVQHQGQTLQIYRPKTKPGQLKIEQIVVTLTPERIIAANRDSVVKKILDAIVAGKRSDALADDALFQLVINKADQRLAKINDASSRPSNVHWYVRPLALGRIIRDLAKVDRGNKVKILELLEDQGFDAIKGMGGIVAVNHDEFDFLHRGYIHAPPVTDQPDRYRLAARMLQFPNSQLDDLPSWIPADTASVLRANWKLEKAFWASETLVDKAFDDEIFRQSIDGIRDDEEGPQIDIEKNVLPALDDHLLLLTDNTVPIEKNSERVLVAIRVRNAQAISTAVRKAMEVEPDVTLIDEVPGVEIWKVERTEGGGDEFEEEFFDDFEFEEGAKESQEPILNTWAIAMVPQGKGSQSPYLVFASHVDYLVQVAKNMQNGGLNGLATTQEIKDLIATAKAQGAQNIAIQRIIRLPKAFRAKYELQRRGELKDNDSVLASIIRRLVPDEAEEGEIDRPNVSKWPPFESVEKYLGNAASFVETTEEGWDLNGFLLHTAP